MNKQEMANKFANLEKKYMDKAYLREKIDDIFKLSELKAKKDEYSEIFSEVNLEQRDGGLAAIVSERPELSPQIIEKLNALMPPYLQWEDYVEAIAASMWNELNSSKEVIDRGDKLPLVKYPQLNKKLMASYIDNLKNIFDGSNQIIGDIYRTVGYKNWTDLIKHYSGLPMPMYKELYFEENRISKKDPMRKKVDSIEKFLKQREYLDRLYVKEEDINNVDAAIEEGIKGRELAAASLPDPEDINTTYSIVGQHPINDKLFFNITNDPINRFCMSEGQGWQHGSCERYWEYEGYNFAKGGLISDTTWKNAVAYIEDHKGKVWARAALRWCYINNGHIDSDFRYDQGLLMRYVETEVRSIFNHLKRESEDDVFREFSDKLDSKFYQIFTHAYKPAGSIISDSELADIFATAPDSDKKNTLIASKIVSRLFKESDIFGPPSIGIEAIWYNIGGDGFKAAINDKRMHVAPNLTAAKATALLSGVLKKEGFDMSYASCITPYEYGGYSDTMETDATVIDYSSEHYQTQTPALFWEEWLDNIHSLEMCPKCGKVVYFERWVPRQYIETMNDIIDNRTYPNTVVKTNYEVVLTEPQIEYDTMLVGGEKFEGSVNAPDSCPSCESLIATMLEQDFVEKMLGLEPLKSGHHLLYYPEHELQMVWQEYSVARFFMLETNHKCAREGIISYKNEGTNSDPPKVIFPLMTWVEDYDMMRYMFLHFAYKNGVKIQLSADSEDLVEKELEILKVKVQEIEDEVY